MSVATPIWWRFERQVAFRDCSRARAKTGKRIAARMAIIAITTSNSINVKARRPPFILRPSKGNYFTAENAEDAEKGTEEKGWEVLPEPSIVVLSSFFSAL